MISELYPYAMYGVHCEHCKKKCDTPEHYPFMVAEGKKKAKETELWAFIKTLTIYKKEAKNAHI